MTRTRVEQRNVVVRSCIASALTGAALAFYASCSAAGPLESIPIGQGFNQPLFVTAPTGDGRLFVVEKGGVIKIMSGGARLDTPFLDISTLVRTDSESGLLGLAFDPNFAIQGAPGYGTFYVNYIDRDTRNTVVASYQVSGSNANLADTATAKTILTVPQAPYDNHKAGWIGFRPNEPDNLYIATGDGGDGNDPGRRAQDLTNNLGKILRVNVHAADAGRNYAVPADNPFVGKDGNDEIWAYGLRNPYRNSFDRLTGDFYIADVGQGTREEINFEDASDPNFAGGANYGWPAKEGAGDNPDVDDEWPETPVDPILHYARPPDGSSIIGGYVERGGTMPELEGYYLFGDYVSDRIWAIQYEGSFIDISQARDVTDLFNPVVDPTTERRMITGLSSFGEDGFGRIYLVDLAGGAIYAMVPEPATWAMMLAVLVPLIAVARRRTAVSGR